MSETKAVVKSLNEIPVLKITDDERVRNKFVDLYKRIHGSEKGETMYELEKFHFNKLLQENKSLQECTHLSLYGAFLDISVQGISIDPMRKLAYLIPQSVNIGTKEAKKYEKRAVLTISPYGELFLRQDYGQIRHADNPVLVYESDKYSIITGKDGRIVNHEAIYPRKSTKIIACYIRIIKADGTIDFSVLDEPGMLRLKAYSERKNFGKPNALFSSGPGGQPDAGFWEAKTIKHAFDSYPKVKLKGQHTQLESQVEEDDDKVPAKIDYSLEMPAIEEPKPEPKKLEEKAQQEDPPAPKAQAEKKEPGESIPFEEVEEVSDKAKMAAVTMTSDNEEGEGQTIDTEEEMF